MDDGKPSILDSGDRTKYSTGAVRDIKSGKGRCDLMPMDIISDYINDPYIHLINEFLNNRTVESLLVCGRTFCNDKDIWPDVPTAILELSIHFEQGAVKYGERNWEKGIPLHSYIDSAIRHRLKMMRGDTDEPHDRAFLWNIVAAIWTIQHKPELIDI